ncbi:DUF6261 family protein [Capnocytophaga canimorsus]|uniref:Uncharacterized protein n=2 Tax=Capnocytophaga canimorsus TaxID=28188 RepID=F9YS82_CAPCC|nr:DUF6261 family protein [Capnocytophaga canimorsus]AEK22635.1 Hypothetical protein Ccan_05150 [Capnocytophaga canimorsus Cc5]ATA77796.1 hypothetical protein CGC47_09525 [Capnocytophaga canimorsus]ATA92425.1 hypothetical protein CGC56_09800 [Capnocytophaga canimorsus]ATA94557.1 hypothetical protein CGC54_09530 [Capnocytophaga canimorsus]AWL79271.1 hypothetical protein DKB58_10150 [Capnocytophaga canimorsus]
MKVNYRKLSTKDLAALTERVIEAVKQSDSNEAKTHLFMKKLEASYQKYYAVLSKQAFSGKGKQVAQADKERDKAFSDIKVFLSGYVRVSSAPNIEAAVALYEQFKIHGLKQDQHSYAEQTVQLGKLIQALLEEENQNHIKKLSLEAAFENLKAKHEEFKMYYNEQAQANAELREITSATKQRKELERDLRRFLSLVTLMFDAEEWISLYNNLNEFVKAAKS